LATLVGVKDVAAAPKSREHPLDLRTYAGESGHAVKVALGDTLVLPHALRIGQ
jgi:hypothetical protein